MKRVFFLMAGLLLVGGMFAFAQVKSWKIAKDHSVTFSSKGVNGVFTTFKGTIQFDEAAIADAKFDLTLDVNSINTGNAVQNKHAKGAEWFDADKYPTIKFTSTSFEKKDKGYVVKGKLQIKDVTKDVTIPFDFSKTGSKGKFTAAFSVDRSQYHVGKNGGDVGNIIKINASIPVTK